MGTGAEHIKELVIHNRVTHQLCRLLDLRALVDHDLGHDVLNLAVIGIQNRHIVLLVMVMVQLRCFILGMYV
ncbi:hypothetical protein SDC9_170699 [bioreactor metagenome]|uniref:Uncharacterized protein n=1 Tax=bioreactor metagenome TaxID=1076179 RepID=A0A645G8S0_9ZZZZ